MRTEFSSLTWILLQHQVSVINPRNDGSKTAESGHAAEDNLSVGPGDLVHPHHHGLARVDDGPHLAVVVLHQVGQQQGLL